MKGQKIVGEVTFEQSNVQVEVRTTEVVYRQLGSHEERPAADHQVNNHLKTEGAGDSRKFEASPSEKLTILIAAPSRSRLS